MTDSIEVTVEKLRRVRAELYQIMRQQERIEPLERMSEQYTKQILEYLKRKDLVNPSNYGWEARIINFLLDTVILPRDSRDKETPVS